MIGMKDKMFYIKIIIILFAVFSSINTSNFYDERKHLQMMFKEDASYALVEKNVINKRLLDKIGAFINILTRYLHFEDKLELTYL